MRGSACWVEMGPTAHYGVTAADYVWSTHAELIPQGMVSLVDWIKATLRSVYPEKGGARLLILD